MGKLPVWVWVFLAVLLLVLSGGAVALYAYTEAEKKRIGSLRPGVLSAFERLRAAVLAKHGIKIRVVSGGRTLAEQAQKFAAGRSATTKSWHRVDRAIDFAVEGPGGAWVIAPKTDLEIGQFRKVALEAQAQGWNQLGFNADGSTRHLLSAGRTFTDPGHIDFREGRTWEQAASEVGVA